MGSFREIRRVDSDKVKGYIDYFGFYTAGTDEDLKHLLFDLCNASLVIHSDNIEAIATDIFNHSSEFAINEYVGFDNVSDSRMISCIMADLTNNCCRSSFIKL